MRGLRVFIFAGVWVLWKKNIFRTNNSISTDYKSFSLSSYYCIFELTTSQNQIKMKKKQVLLAVFAATMLTPTVVRAQYPQITGEAKKIIQR